MIKGIGTDIVEIARIADLLEKHGDIFKKKIFTSNEIEDGVKRKNRPNFFAGRWAAKEAFSKAIGTGFGADCSWLDIEIVSNDLGKPEITLKGKAAETAEKLGVSSIHLSISHEESYACAMVVAE